MYNRKNRGPNTEPCGTEETNFSFRNTWADVCCLASIFKIKPGNEKFSSLTNFVLYRILCYLFAKVTPVKTKVLNLMFVTTATAATLGMSNHYHFIRRSHRPILKATFQKCTVKLIYEKIY